MNDNHSRYEFVYRNRWLGGLIKRAIQDHPVVVLSGARQTGKSTFLRNEHPFSGWRYVSLDDFDVLEQAKHNPQALWAGSVAIILDEVQKAPGLLSAVKKSIDSDRFKVRFVLSGSANLLLMKQVSESLAGWAVYFNLLPMSLGEAEGLPAPEWLRQLFKGHLPDERTCALPEFSTSDLILKGFMPPLLTLKSRDSIVGWWEGYVATYLERDLREISQISSLVDFRRAMEALALRSGQLLNQTEIARDTGISQPTIHRYLNLLETTCVFERLPAFAVNRTKRLIKSTKPYWIDPGLATYLAGHHDVDGLANAREAGSLFETLVFLHLKTAIQLLVPRPRLYYWRTATGKEIDFVIEQGRKLAAIEVKLATEVRYGDTLNLRLFLEEYPEAMVGVLVYAGCEIKRLDDRIIAIPWHLLAGVG